MSGAGVDVPPDIDIILEPLITAPHRARAAIGELLSDADRASEWDDAILATSEVVSLVLTQRPEPCRLAAWHAPATGWLRVEVFNAHDGMPNAATDADHPEVDRLSLAVLGVVPHAWGIERTPFGQLVWFEVTRHAMAVDEQSNSDRATPSSAILARTEGATRAVR